MTGPTRGTKSAKATKGAGSRRRRADKHKPAPDIAPGIDRFRARHLDLAAREVMTGEGVARVVVNDSESPLAWLARRKGRDGRAMIDQNQFVAARQRVRLALQACGPEFAGVLMDVCCFLRGLEDVERERGWPSRSAKVVLQLALDRLARHYGLRTEARCAAASRVRVWLADDTAFTS